MGGDGWTPQSRVLDGERVPLIRERFGRDWLSAEGLSAGQAGGYLEREMERGSCGALQAHSPPLPKMAAWEVQ